MGPMMHSVRNSRLSQVSYEIRGSLFELAEQLERQGHRITRLNIGNPAAFGFQVPDQLMKEIVSNMSLAQGYCDSKGLAGARGAIEQYALSRGIGGVRVEDIYIGNGVSELILMCMQGLLNEGDEVLIPSPDYPLWTAAVNLAGGKPIHYRCDPDSEWQPDLQDLEAKITSRTRALVVINPNNPTGAVYPAAVLKSMAELAAKHQIAIFSDEIYDKILYDDAEMTSIASLTQETLCVTFGGLSKNYRAAGFRAGWMILSGDLKGWAPYRDGLTVLASMRLCSNVLAQLAIQSALTSDRSINDLVLPAGRLREQRDLSFERLSKTPGLSVWKAKGALYLFPKIDLEMLGLKSDYEFCFELLKTKQVLTVQGSGFNWITPDRFRLVFLPSVEELGTALDRIEEFCRERAEQHAGAKV